jgi:hypothetical protein
MGNVIYVLLLLKYLQHIDLHICVFLKEWYRKAQQIMMDWGFYNGVSVKYAGFPRINTENWKMSSMAQYV